MILGVDTGGTFTDFVLWRGESIRVHKVLSTPDNPAQAILQGLNDLGLHRDQDQNYSANLHVVHGSTVATNAVLEGKLAKTVFVTNRGLKDLLTIGRQARRELYNLTPQPIAAPVPEELCVEVAGRISAQGEILEPFTQAVDAEFIKRLEALKPQAVAINLLFSFLDDAAEKHIAALIPEHVFVTRSSSLLPVYREYERGMTTWLNAATGPLMRNYLQHLSEQLQPATLTVMQSSGDTLDAEQASMRSAHLLLSGPAGGLLGAQAVARLVGEDRIMTFDMGGTSTDVALIDGEIRLTDEGCIAGYPVALPMVDMHTIGAGGGSLAWLDEGGLLHVGPQSAGAAPGPACYGQGGTQATVTDANVILGRLPVQTALGGALPLDRDSARVAVASIASRLGCDIETAAMGIVDLANEHMAAALRVISVEKGDDPQEFTLVSFGGAGGLHVCDLADSLGMTQAMAPVHAGVLSAYGMLVAPRGRRYVQTFVHPFSGSDKGRGFDAEKVEAIYAAMQAKAEAALEKEGIDKNSLSIKRQADVRYIGQSSTLRVDWDSAEKMAETFHAQHKQRRGHALQEPLELVNLHCAVQAVSKTMQLPLIKPCDSNIQGKIGEQAVMGCDKPVPVYDRLQLGAGQQLIGPALVIEDSATTWIKPGWTAHVDGYGNMRLVRREEKHESKTCNL